MQPQKKMPKLRAPRPPADAYAKELIERYGSRARNVAVHRFDAAGTQETAAYYAVVLREMDQMRLALLCGVGATDGDDEDEVEVEDDALDEEG